jgi:hypothetical protein
MTTPFDATFAALSERLGVVVSLDDSASMRGRVVMSRAGAVDPQRWPHGVNRDDEQSWGRMAHPWTATVYGDSDLEVSNRAAQMIAWLDLLEGPPDGSPADGDPDDSDYVPERLGYAVKGGKVEPRGATGYACDLAMTLYTPITTAVHASIAVSEVEATIQTTDTDGTDAVDALTVAA